MSSLDKMLSLLDVFTPAAPVWTTEDLIRYSGAPASTCYRYLKTLHSGGLLARVANGSYVLGPRIPELDRTMRLCDPVYIAGSPVIQQLTEETGHSSLLCILFSESIMCVQQALGKHAPPELFSRGQRRPLVAGASAKIILAYLPLHQLRVIFTKHRKSIAAVGLGADWERFKQALKQIRQAEYAMTTGEYNAGIVSIAAPLFNGAGDVLGSLAVAASTSHVDPVAFGAIAERVIEAGREVSRRIASAPNIVALPARAVG
ncbi:IclR family transcriptional regulator [Pigmentiphaga sp.]|uniref:IclR family transcriptional regulator n=1 Tax=Pigmentiphaga sp. TaxID=1977564 RepID=UPI00128B939B|nr:IclR family transcriptional regulator [Pigmentiphaga sp.]MPS30206.1 IclR family transcriptional regulator [Alcaligenaceae bacterium SAGV5]MPS55081.1 IclR family transcriptional regulator [Alcaligenaceae bacterium SAGV3]MPT55329.1 IclR family transcriptional regulator [Alcaligenaceae bacterium]